jgi:hypothetical protein
MGQCYGKGIELDDDTFKREKEKEEISSKASKRNSSSYDHHHNSSSKDYYYSHESYNNSNWSSHSSFHSAGGAASPARTTTKATALGLRPPPSPGHLAASPLPRYASSTPSTPLRLFKRPFPPPSPARHIQSSLVKRHGRAAAGAPNPNQGGAGGVAAVGATAGGFIPQSSSVELCEKPLDKHFGYPKNFSAKYELGHEVGRGHFGHTCFARIRKGDLKGQPIAVKIISKAKVSVSSSSCCISSLSLSQHLPSMLALLHVIVSLLQLKKKIHSSSTAAATYIPSGFIHILSFSPSLSCLSIKALLVISLQHKTHSSSYHHCWKQGTNHHSDCMHILSPSLISIEALQCCHLFNRNSENF